MSVQCPKCNKTLSSRKSWLVHLEKLTPCDFACKHCEVKTTDKASYLIHQRTFHFDNTPKHKNASPISEKKTVIAKKRAVASEQKNDLVPIQDFSSKIAEIVKHVMAMAQSAKEDGTGFEAKLTIDIKVDPALNAARTFRHSDFESSLRCLESPDDATRIAAGVLTNMHSDPKRPEMHTIKMKDVSRKQVNIYSRPSEEDPGKWLPYSHEAALKKLSEHAASLVRCALAGSINTMTYKCRDEGKFICCCLPTQIEDKNIIIYDQNDDDETGLQFNNGIILKVELYDGELLDIPDDQEYKDRIRELDTHIKAKGTQVLKKLRDIRFTDKDIGAFLERTRRPLTMIENID